MTRHLAGVGATMKQEKISQISILQHMPEQGTHQSFLSLPQGFTQGDSHSPGEWHGFSHRCHPHPRSLPHVSPHEVLAWLQRTLVTWRLPQAHVLVVRKTQGGQIGDSWQAWLDLGWPQAGGGRMQGKEQERTGGKERVSGHG